MSHHSRFTRLELDNRLGQKVFLGVTYVPTQARDYLFVTALNQQASSFVGKNADHFAFQLLHHFQLDTKRFELVELRGAAEEQSLWRWRFEWVGTAPLSGRGELVTSPAQQLQLMRLLDADDQLKAAAP